MKKIAIIALALAFALVSCNDKESEKAKQPLSIDLGSITEKVKETAEKTKDAAEEGLDTLSEKAKDATEKTKDTAKEAEESASKAAGKTADSLKKLFN